MLCHNTCGIEISIQSIENQLMPEDELILVDDHSDGPFLNRLASLLPPQGRILSVPNPGRNRSQNRNLGAAESNGDILVFIDGDIAVNDSALEQIRLAYQTNVDVAYVGTEHGMKYDEQQAILISGRDDYITALASPREREAFFHDPILSDWRGDDLHNPEDRPYFWLRFYTSFCAVRKDIFIKAGGFDETFRAWGAEDVDLGYRISLLGGIGYLPQVHCIHIPHPRDSFQNELTNRRNTYYMVGKYRNWQIETLAAFGSTPGMQRMIAAVLQRLAAVKLTPLPITAELDTLYVDAPGKVFWTGCDKCAPMLGMALPFPNRSFLQVVISDHIFLYPPLITSRILQETLRVGKTVWIVRSGDQTRLGWEDDGVICGIPFPRICRYASELLDFEFIPDGSDRWRVRSGTYAYTPDPSAPVDIRDGDKVLPEGLVLINLSDAPDGEAANAARRLLQGDVIAVYHFAPQEALKAPCLLNEQIPSDFCHMNSRLAYCVNSLDDVRGVSGWMECRERAGEEFAFDLTGKVARLGGIAIPSED